MEKKTDRFIVWLQTLAGFGSLLVAVVALVIAFNTEKRSAERFRAELEQSKQIAQANIRPLLSIGSSGFIGVKLIVVENSGLGTAVVTKIEFSKGERRSLNLAELIEFQKRIVWDNFYVFGSADWFLEAGKNVKLVHLTFDGLLGQGFSRAEIAQILREFDEQQKGIVIRIEYEDLLGNKQEDIAISLE